MNENSYNNAVKFISNCWDETQNDQVPILFQVSYLVVGLSDTSYFSWGGGGRKPNPKLLTGVGRATIFGVLIASGM